MHIIEIILDGFKSYSSRTIVGGNSLPHPLDFDPQFNAITGLNGSGKSNILDAICFVLGITRLANVRAENLQELIYKQGNSGVQKASVSITFSNFDKRHSPPGFEELDKIQVTRTVDNQKSKYYINGRSENLEKVKNLFCSVKLNVNNPHFLIMQGRVTKVINMKPMEILGLIEEAAGISLYQKKKEETLATIKKKDNKLAEINAILENEVTPQLEKLKGERETFQQFRSNENYLEELHKQIVAFDYSEYSKVVFQQENFERQNQEEGAHLRTNSQIVQREVQELKQAITSLDHEGNEQRVQTVKLKIAQQEKAVYKVEVELKSCLENELTVKGQVAKLRREAEQASLALNKFQKLKMEVGQELDENLKSELEKKKEALREMEQQLVQLKEGKQVENLEEKIHQQIQEQETRISNIANKRKAVLREKEMKKQNMAQLEKKLAERRQDKQESEKQLQGMKQKISKLKQERASFSQCTEAFSSLQSQISSLSSQLEQLQPQLSHYGLIANRVGFNFGNVPGLDRSLVKGRLITLFRVKDHKKYGTAIEGVGGGQLWSVLVANEIVCKELLKHKASPFRVSYIPLNKIKAEVIPPEKIQEIKRVTNDKARLAIELIDYDPSLEAAMRFVFGNTFVVEDEQTAKKVTYNMGKRSVTLKGDMYNPSGILSGGFNESQNLIQQVQELKELEKKKLDLMEEKRKLEFQLQPLAQEYRKFEELGRSLQNAETELKLYEEKGQESQSAAFEEENLAHWKEELEEYDNKLVHINFGEEKAKKQVGELKQELDVVRKQGGSQKSREDFYLKKVKELKKERQELEGQIKNNDQQAEQLTLKSEEARKDLQNYQRELEKAEKLLEEEGKNAQKQKIFKTQEEQKLKELEKQKAQIEQENNKNNSEKDKMSAQINTKTEKLKEIEHELKLNEESLKKFLSSVSACQSQMRKLLDENKWIQTEKDFFGQKGTKYDFQSFNIHQLKEAQKKVTEQNEDLKKRVNLKVDAMFEDTEKSYNELQRKKEIIKNNRKEFEHTIEKLDFQKNKDIEHTWEKVNKFCNEIYSTLLQGASAKLCPPEGKSVHEGLELRVAFSGIWKDSLSELSGGQRSLLALSLILALLKYHPAPLYILDEIDSALDLSHTQNIGIMIRKFFMNSQFIIVSLKEGLFQNANVLFKVSFLDNKSSVKRFQVRKNEKKGLPMQEDNDEVEALY